MKFNASAKSIGGDRQSGAALIMALIVVAIVSVLAVEFSSSFNLNVTRAENRLYGSQAKEYLLATESMAAYFLKQDAADTELDSLLEAWATPITLPTDEGMLDALLEDAQGRFNLNSLALNWEIPGKKQNPAPWERFSPAQRRFIRLLQTFGEAYPLDEQQAIEILEAIIDWTDDDEDNVTGFGGAETLYYSNLEKPYFPANQKFSSVSELQMIKGVTPELYILLEPLVTVLPTGDEPLNINTALPQLLQTLNSQEILRPLEADLVNPMIEERQLQEFESVADFFANPSIQNVAPNLAQNNAGFDVKSSYFLLHARTTVGDQVRHVTSLLERTEEKVIVKQRRYTSF